METSLFLAFSNFFSGRKKANCVQRWKKKVVAELKLNFQFKMAIPIRLNHYSN